MDDPTSYAIFRNGKITARVIPGHRQLWRMELDQPQAGLLRQVTYQGLREDKPAQQIRRERLTDRTVH